MNNRRSVTPITVAAVADEFTGHPLQPKHLPTFADSFELVLQAMDSLRLLPLKEVEPAVIFRPYRTQLHD